MLSDWEGSQSEKSRITRPPHATSIRPHSLHFKAAGKTYNFAYLVDWAVHTSLQFWLAEQVYSVTRVFGFKRVYFKGLAY